jgi:hypothetical protein
MYISVVVCLDTGVWVLVLDSHLHVGAEVFTLLLLVHIINGWVCGYCSYVFKNHVIFYEN